LWRKHGLFDKGWILRAGRLSKLAVISLFQQVAEKLLARRHPERSEGSVLFNFRKIQQMLRRAQHGGGLVSASFLGLISPE
jgi:hypothetical protein